MAMPLVYPKPCGDVPVPLTAPQAHVAPAALARRCWSSLPSALGTAANLRTAKASGSRPVGRLRGRGGAGGAASRHGARQQHGRAQPRATVLEFRDSDAGTRRASGQRGKVDPNTLAVAQVQVGGGAWVAAEVLGPPCRATPRKGACAQVGPAHHVGRAVRVVGAPSVVAVVDGVL